VMNLPDSSLLILDFLSTTINNEIDDLD
jgi:hypothetical protein